MSFILLEDAQEMTIVIPALWEHEPCGRQWRLRTQPASCGFCAAATDRLDDLMKQRPR